MCDGCEKGWRGEEKKKQELEGKGETNDNSQQQKYDKSALQLAS